MDYTNDEFKPNVNFPVIFSSFGPGIRSHIGKPEKFYFGGLNMQHISEIQFKRNLLLTSEINQPIYQNFNEAQSRPESLLPHVRTEVIDYLQQDDIYITRMQLDYIFSPYKEVYAKFSGGIYEAMFGGIGAEILYKPFLKNYYIGLELYHVKQRSYEQRFGFMNYDTTTGHINFGYLLPLGVEANISFGRYLAKDDGYTFDLSRTTKSGFKTGFYFTRTNVSAELFGEGSFDKGFYIQVPLDLLTGSNNGNYSNFKLAPLTRDGGAKLMYDKDLRGLINNSRLSEIYDNWDGFLN